MKCTAEGCGGDVVILFWAALQPGPPAEAYDGTCFEHAQEALVTLGENGMDNGQPRNRTAGAVNAIGTDEIRRFQKAHPTRPGLPATRRRDWER